MLQGNFPLKRYNTFGIAVKARYFSSFTNLDELNELLEYNPSPRTDSRLSILILGGGSNILFTGDFDGLVLKNEMQGIEVINEDDIYVYVRAGGGVNWHRLVVHCINNGLGGIENLSLIPGNAGASPMQNIGAYGVEIKDVFFGLQAFHIKEKTVVEFGLDDCEFGYRESVFKKKI